MAENQEFLIRQYDASVKRFLANKKILAWILKECADEFKSIPVNTIEKKCIIGEPEISVAAVDQDEADHDECESPEIEGLNTEDASVNEGNIYYDIRFRAVVPGGGQPIYLIVNIEAQKDDNPGYPLLRRAVYYTGRLISSQKQKIFTGSHYEKIQKVYSIWIEMNVAEKNQNTITKYRIIEENIVGHRKNDFNDYDLINIIMIGLGEKDSIRNNSILRLLNVALDKKAKKPEVNAVLQNEFGIYSRGTLGKEINTMCNLGEGLVESITKEVTEEVTASVTASVQTDTWVRAAVSIMKKFGVSADEAIDTLNIPEEKREVVLSQIEDLLVPAA